MNNELYFNVPTQVAFRDDEAVEDFIGGIAYKDFIICTEDGTVVPLDDAIELVKFKDWIDLDEYVLGETDFEDLNEEWGTWVRRKDEEEGE